MRSVDLQLSGSGFGSWSKTEIRTLFTQIIPEMFELAANHKLQVNTTTIALKDIGKLWEAAIPGGKRLVVTAH